jgi:hypothetical protein
MCVVLLRLPLTSVLLATLLLATDGLPVMSLVIVTAVVASVFSAPAPAAPARLRCRSETRRSFLVHPGSAMRLARTCTDDLLGAVTAGAPPRGS